MQMSKPQWRRRIRTARNCRSEQDLRLAAQGLAAQADAVARLLDQAGTTTVAGYLALPGEPDPALLLHTLGGRGIRVLMPRVGTDDEGAPLLTFAAMGALAPGQPTATGLRLMEPIGPQVPLPVEAVLLLPALAVDGSGTRLGQGGGYYDRLLSRPRSGPALAVVYEQERLAAGTLPREPHDAPTDGCLTPVRLDLRQRARFRPGRQTGPDPGSSAC